MKITQSIHVRKLEKSLIISFFSPLNFMAKLLGHSAVVSSHSSALILAGLSLPDSMIQLWFLKWFVSINVGLHLALEDASFNACNVFLYVKMQIAASKFSI